MSSKEKLFIIAVGGTGMRCLEAFTHLCAVGMFDGQEFDVLTIDTDTNNGNKGRTEQLIDRYIRIKGGGDGKPSANSFFTAKLNLFTFAPQYSGDSLTFSRLSNLATGPEELRRRNQDLADLLFSKDVQDFHLDHGYRAQTHLGSHLMYHAIIEAARRVQRGGEAPRREDVELMDFVNRIYEAADGARVFILGSIFGGTGASSIPVLPRAIADALKVRDKNLQISAKARFGCSLLTDYFSFNVPDDAQRREKKIIADSNNFARNSQAALMFYEADDTIQKHYRRMYHVGWPFRSDLSKGGETITGGGEQTNPCHPAELLSAAAAHDFFNFREDSGQAEIVYRSVNVEGRDFFFEFGDLVGVDFANRLMHRLGIFHAMCHVILVIDEGVENTVRSFQEYGTSDYVNLSNSDLKDVGDYLKSFAFGLESPTVNPGWWFQVWHAGLKSPKLFNLNAFVDSVRELRDFHFGELFVDPQHQFALKGRIPFTKGNPYEEWKATLTNDTSVRPDPNRQGVSRLNEKFLAHCFNALTKLYNFA